MKNTPHPGCIQGKVEIKRTYIHGYTHTSSVPPTKRSRHLAWLDHLCPSSPLVVLVSFALRISSKIVSIFCLQLFLSQILFVCIVWKYFQWNYGAACLCVCASFFGFSVYAWASVYSVFCMFSVFYQICAKCILIEKEPVCSWKPVAVRSSWGKEGKARKLMWCKLCPKYAPKCHIPTLKYQMHTTLSPNALSHI